jgi:hypothetical protein
MDALYIKVEENHLDDEAEAVREMLSYTKATSLLGAAAQVIQAMVCATRLYEAIGEPSHRSGQLNRQIARLLYSVLDVIEAELGQPLTPMIGFEMTNPHLNPWLPSEDRLALARTHDRRAQS